MMMRILKYREAISEGLCQAMERDSSIFVTGIGTDYPSGIFGTTTEALQRFGPERVFESPAMENALTGICIGAAAMGKRPVIVHARNDFLFLALDQLINLAAKWRYMYGGNAGSVPIVVRAIIGQGWGQGATHSQSLQSVLAHFPGMVVAMPSTSADAKAMICEALCDVQPTILLEHRALYETEGEVPAEWYRQPWCAFPWRYGADLSIVATSAMVPQAMTAAETLADRGIESDVIDARSIRPLDHSLILNSVNKTRHLIVADGSWGLCGFASEVAALVAEHAPGTKVKRITWPDCPCPVSLPLEQQFYPNAQTIVDAALEMLGRTRVQSVISDFVPRGEMTAAFTGPY